LGWDWDHSINNWNRDGRFLNHSKQSNICMLGVVFTGMAFLFLDLSGWELFLHDAGCLKGADEAGNGKT
jgi:hypothetical protein